MATSCSLARVIFLNVKPIVKSDLAVPSALLNIGMDS